MKRTIQIILFVIILSSCGSPSPSPLPINFWGSIDCRVSCWEELRPGNTTGEEVMRFFSSFFENFESGTNGQQYEFFRANKDVEKGYRYSVQAYVIENRLMGVFLHSKNAFDLTLEEIIQTLGASEYTVTAYAMAVETDAIYPYLLLYYPEDGYAFLAELEIQSRDNSMVRACSDRSTYVFDIYVVEAGDITSVVSDVDYFNFPQMQSEQISQYVSSLSQWEGYGCTNLTYPPQPQEDIHND